MERDDSVCFCCLISRLLVKYWRKIISAKLQHGFFGAARFCSFVFFGVRRGEMKLQVGLDRGVNFTPDFLNVNWTLSINKQLASWGWTFLAKQRRSLAGSQYFQNGHLLLPVSVSEEDKQIIQARDHVLPTIFHFFFPLSLLSPSVTTIISSISSSPSMKLNVNHVFCCSKLKPCFDRKPKHKQEH